MANDKKKSNCNANPKVTLGTEAIEGVTLTSNRPAITLDCERYDHHLANSGMTEAQKQDYLQAMWVFVREFIALGYGVHPLQEIDGKVCGYVAKDGGQPALLTPDMLDLESKTITATFKDMAQLETDLPTEGV